MELILPNQKLVLKAFSALADLAPGSTKYTDHVNFINASTVYNQATGLKTLDGSVVYIDALNTMFGSVSTADLATAMLSNLGLSSIFTQAEGVSYLSSSANRVKAVLDLAEALSNYAGTNAAVLAAKDAYNSALDLAYNYSITAGNTAVLALNDSVFSTFTLTTGVDNLTGTAGIDNFVARTQNNVNTLNDADTLNGGAGSDSLYVDLVAQTSAITPKLTSIESVIIRAQTTTADVTNGNNMFNNLVQVDAQRSLAVDVADHVTAATGVTRWESNNSRSDLVIEDVRIGNSNKTSDVTIAMVETDPGNVDFGVYFDQQSLRNAASGSTTLTINLMDTGAAGRSADAAKPLLDNPYDLFKLAINGVMTSIQLDKAAVKAADTYELLLAAFQVALTGTGVTVALGANFTVIDPISTKAVTGKSIVITGNDSAVITTPDGSGWFNTTGASVPPTANIYNTFGSGASSVTELVTSKVVLDDVGRSNLGGDLVIGGMSTGDTSNYSIYRGVERFEITVGDNSKLQTINSTNNALREVTIVSGATSRTVADAYTTTVTNEGDLVVNGDAASNLSLTGATRGQSIAVPVGGTQSGGNNDLPGVENNSPVGIHHGGTAAGFTDVRLIDASQFKGKLGFTAAITADTIAKYVNLIDVAPAAPAADIAADGNVNFGIRGANFIYTGGNDDDTMTVTIDGAAASSRSTVISGQSDFTFAFNGGAGNDAITLNVINGNLAGGAQAWYNNQKLNANIAIGAGDGDDVVRTPGAGDVIIDAGAGNDTVYTDNTGALSTANSTGRAGTAAVAYANAAAAELASAISASVASNTTGFIIPSQKTGVAFLTPTTAAANLNTLNLTTPVDFASAPSRATLDTDLLTAVNSGSLTFDQYSALKIAYGSWGTATASVPSITMAGQPLPVGGTINALALTQAQFDAGNALLDTYIAAMKATAATATSNDTFAPAAAALLNATQADVLNATVAVNAVYDPVAGGTTESSTVTWKATTGASTQTIGGATVTSALVTESASFAFAAVTPVGAGLTNILTIAGRTVTVTQPATATAADIATAFATGVSTGGAIVGGALAGYTAAVGVAGTTVFTSTTAATNVADLTMASAGTAPAAPVVAPTYVQGSDGNFTAINVAQVASGGAAISGLSVTTSPAWTVGPNGGTANTVLTSTTANINVPDLGAGSFTGSTTAPTAVLVAQGAGVGTQTLVNNLTTLSGAIASGTTDVAVVNALQAAINNGSITVTQGNSLFGAAVATAGTVDATELANFQAILTPIQTSAANLNTAAQAVLTAAIAVNATAVNTASNIVALDPVAAAASFVHANDFVGSAESATAVTNAKTALYAVDNSTAPAGTAAGTLNVANTAKANLAALKSAILAGTTDTAVVTATSNAVANGSITLADKVAIDLAATAVTGTVGAVVTATEKLAVDRLIVAKEVTNDTTVAKLTLDAANLQSVVAATTLASETAAAAAGSGTTSLTVAAPKAVFVFDTSNQTSTYNLVTMDDRNLADLKSSANDSNNFFNSTLKVTYKGIDSSVVVAGTGYKTTDLELNQSIKLAINSNAVLNKLLLATDGPANTLVVTSLIDGAQVTGNLALTVTMPTTVSAADLAGAAAAYSLAAGSTEAQVLAAMTTAKAAFDTRGDYVTQFAESGSVNAANSANGNVALVGANSTSSSDNTITLGTGDDVLVLGTTESNVDMMTSSNEKVIYSGVFGNDTVVYFDVSGNGIDMLDFTALNGRGNVALNSLSLDKSIVIAAPTAAGATVLSAAQIAALFTDSATAINHVYVAVDSTNIGSIWQVADAAGVAAGNVVATLVGTIDLADTAWGTLTAANFA